MEWTPILFVVGFMALMLAAVWPYREVRWMLLVGIFFVLSFAGLVEEVLFLLGPEAELLEVAHRSPAESGWVPQAGS